MSAPVLGSAGVDRQSLAKWAEINVSVLPLEPGARGFARAVGDGHLTVFVGWIPGDGWHLSISHRTNHHPPRPGRNPRWAEIKEARYLFCPPDVTMAMLLPPEEEFVNVHETTFHLHEWPQPVVPDAFAAAANLPFTPACEADLDELDSREEAKSDLDDKRGVR